MAGKVKRKGREDANDRPRRAKSALGEPASYAAAAVVRTMLAVAGGSGAAGGLADIQSRLPRRGRGRRAILARLVGDVRQVRGRPTPSLLPLSPEGRGEQNAPHFCYSLLRGEGRRIEA